MIAIEKDQQEEVLRIILTPNRSISWPLLVKFYLFTCGVSFSIAMLFAFLGYWMVIPFSGLEMMVLGGGLYVTCRKVYRQEVISVDNDHIKLEKGCISVDESWQFDRHWARISIEEIKNFRKTSSLKIGSHGNFVEVGSFLNESEKETLAFELNQSIISSDFLRRVG
ncbi:MAG: DUF2244 domain-containing protein [Gammaproteobacteria bacterium]|nr:DUF2244 domain-containing protein [Gammaproteobacteria bacterium]